jgi:hypothetical protein
VHCVKKTALGSLPKMLHCGSGCHGEDGLKLGAVRAEGWAREMIRSDLHNRTFQLFKVFFRCNKLKDYVIVYSRFSGLVIAR